MPVTVLLVDDVPELRAVLRQLLELQGGFQVVAEAGDGAAAVSAADVYQPELIVLDVGLPDLAGHEVVSRLRAVAHDAQIAVYTGSVSRDRFALAGDVDAYVLKQREASDLVELLVELTGRGRHAASLELGPRASDVALARRFVLAHCARWGCEDLLDDAELVVSELVTNALLHVGNPCELTISFRDGWLRLEIRDDGGGTPDIRAADGSSESGRGLLLVSAMTNAWGVDPSPAGGKVVWAELRSRAEPPTGADDAADEAVDRARRSRPDRPVRRPPGRSAAHRRPQGSICDSPSHG